MHATLADHGAWRHVMPLTGQEQEGRFPHWSMLACPASSIMTCVRPSPRAPPWTSAGNASRRIPAAPQVATMTRAASRRGCSVRHRRINMQPHISRRGQVKR